MSHVSGYKPQGGVSGDNTLTRPHGTGQDADLKDADLKDQAAALGRDLKNKTSNLAETVTQTAKDQASGLRAAAEGFASDATEKVTTAMARQKGAGADYISGIAQAVHRAASEFEGDVPQAAQYIRKASDQLESFAGAIRDRDARQLVGEVQDFARRQPALFFGGALLLGFAALRFLKSSESSSISPSGHAAEARRSQEGA